MDIEDILLKFENCGYEAFFVGGFVRDYLLGVKTYDIDVCTNATLEEIMRIFPNHFEVNKDFLNVKIHYDKYNVDVTRYRKDTYMDGRRNVIIEPVQSIREDVIRRDFTINSLYMDKDFKVCDFVNGIEDLNKRIVRTVGDVNKSIVDDPLRMLRAVRFATILDFEIDYNLFSCMKDNAFLLERLSTQKIMDELSRIFNSKNVKRGFELLTDLNFWKYIGIMFDNVVIVQSDIGMFSQFEYSREYPFNKYYKRNIKNVKDIVRYGKINKEVIFKYGFVCSKIACDILDVSEDEFNQIYNDMVIYKEEDINISKSEIKILLDINSYDMINRIYKELVFLILNNKLNNYYDDIRKYIIYNREKWLK